MLFSPWHAIRFLPQCATSDATLDRPRPGIVEAAHKNDIPNPQMCRIMARGSAPRGYRAFSGARSPTCRRLSNLTISRALAGFKRTSIIVARASCGWYRRPSVNPQVSAAALHDGAPHNDRGTAPRELVVNLSSSRVVRLLGKVLTKVGHTYEDTPFVFIPCLCGQRPEARGIPSIIVSGFARHDPQPPEDGVHINTRRLKLFLMKEGYFVRLLRRPTAICSSRTGRAPEDFRGSGNGIGVKHRQEGRA